MDARHEGYDMPARTSTTSLRASMLYAWSLRVIDGKGLSFLEIVEHVTQFALHRPSRGGSGPRRLSVSACKLISDVLEDAGGA